MEKVTLAELKELFYSAYDAKEKGEYDTAIKVLNVVIPEFQKLGDDFWTGMAYECRAISNFSKEDEDNCRSDYKTAIKYFAKSAQQGNNDALKSLDRIKEIGFDVPSISSVSNSKEYVGVSYDIVDNTDGGFFKRKHPSDGYLVFIIERKKGNPNINDIKFVFDGKEAMLNRNSSQTIYFPYLNGDVCSLLQSQKSIYIMEMEGKNICYEYIAFNQIISTPLPIPQSEKDRFKKK